MRRHFVGFGLVDFVQGSCTQLSFWWAQTQLNVLKGPNLTGKQGPPLGADPQNRGLMYVIKLDRVEEGQRRSSLLKYVVLQKPEYNQVGKLAQAQVLWN